MIDKSLFKENRPSTLCVGCGHDQISRHIIKAFEEAQISPENIAKLSGIGCSSKTLENFLKGSRGFHTLHGRMSSVATGAKIANRDLTVIGVSGDGDTGSIGLSSFLHLVKKNLPMIYILENNGLYGLTKGQLSPLAKTPSQLNLLSLSLLSGAPFVARTLSSNKKELVSLLKLASHFKGFAFIDVISPCVAYGNDKDFDHSFSLSKKRAQSLNELEILKKEDLKNKEGEKISLNKDLSLLVKKTGEKEFDPLNKDEALKVILDEENLYTGLLYFEKKKTFFETKNLSEKASD